MRVPQVHDLISGRCCHALSLAPFSFMASCLFVSSSSSCQCSLVATIAAADRWATRATQAGNRAHTVRLPTLKPTVGGRVLH